MIIQEIIYNGRTAKEYQTKELYMQEYSSHIGYGASGSYDDKTKIGIIHSHLKKCKELEKNGYRNLHFCNGGDDDILIIDHDNKEFAFVEYGDPIDLGSQI